MGEPPRSGLTSSLFSLPPAVRSGIKGLKTWHTQPSPAAITLHIGDDESVCCPARVKERVFAAHHGPLISALLALCNHLTGLQITDMR